MKFQNKQGVSPIIATLLLIAIAVAAGVIVYVYVNSLSGGLTGASGNQVSEELQLQAYRFSAVSGTGPSSSNTVVQISLENVGSSAVTISSVYYDGTSLTEWFNTAGSYKQYLTVDNTASNCFAAIPSGVQLAGSNSASVDASGDGTNCSSEGATQNCSAGNSICLDTGSAQAQTLTLNPQSSSEIVIGLSSAATSGTSHIVKVVTADGGQAVFTVVAGRTG